MSDLVNTFEKRIANFFGSPYAVAVDCCTHGLELCLRFSKVKSINVPRRTYISVPFLADKLNIQRVWKDENWQEYYYLTDNTSRWKIIDAAVLWRENSYIPNSLMCLSFQFQKHLSLGRGGMILTDDKETAHTLCRMAYDGRIPNVPWKEQYMDIQTIGYHYYMTPETAKLGIKKFIDAVNEEPKQWVIEDWPDLSRMEIFR